MNWLGKSIEESKKLRTHYRMKGIDIFIKDMLPENVDADMVFKYISKRIPSHFFSSVDIIYIGNFDVFREKDVNAVFKDGAILVSNKQANSEDMIDDIIHEIAHAVEEKYFDEIYDDQLLKKEFLAKRNHLYQLLSVNDYKPLSAIRNTYTYSEDIDMYFYKEVGYEAMWYLIGGLFPSPYAATSLREYFAIGFEYYFLKDRATLKRDCPVLFSKLSELEYPED